MKISNYFNEWRGSWPVTVLIGLTLVGYGFVAGVIGVVAGLAFEVTGLAQPGDQSATWGLWVMATAMVFIGPVGLNRVLSSWYRDRHREQDTKSAEERARIDVENAAALASGGEAALAKLRNDRWLAEQNPRHAATRR